MIYINFIDIRNMMILCVKKMLVLKQYEYWLLTVLQFTLQTGIKNSNGWLWNAKEWPRDISNYSVLKSFFIAFRLMNSRREPIVTGRERLVKNL